MNNLLVREWDGEKHVNKTIRFRPTIYVPDNAGDFVDIHGITSCSPKTFSVMSEANKFIREYDRIEGFDVYGTKNWNLQYVLEEYGYDIQYEVDKIRVFNFDIETYSDKGFPVASEAAFPINAITIYDSFDKKYHVWSFPVDEDTPPYQPSRDDVVAVHCDSEMEVILGFTRYWAENPPSIITGWNISGFDIPYIINRMANVISDGASNVLSPWGHITSREITNDYGQSMVTYKILGIQTLDYLELYKKFTYHSQESYRLDYIGHVEVGEKKLDYGETTSLHQLYVTDYQKFIDYNIQDVALVNKIDSKMKLIDLIISLGYYSSQNFVDVFSPVRTWESLIYKHLIKRKIVPPATSKFRNSNVSSIPGAYVKQPVTGKLYNWLASFDFASLYPHLIMQYNIGPETLIPQSVGGAYEQIVDKIVDRQYDIGEGNYCVAGNGQHFRIDKKSFLSELMEHLYADRSAIKTKMLSVQRQLESLHNADPAEVDALKSEISILDNAQMARKILLNSLYGGVGNKHFLYFDIRLASAITQSGQVAIKWVSNSINHHLNQLYKKLTKNPAAESKEFVVYCDTDSNYLNLEDFCKLSPIDNNDTDKMIQFMDKFCRNVVQPMIDDATEDLRAYTNCSQNKMNMKREALASAGFWCGKKRYAIRVHNNEGVQYDIPKTKIMGIETQKSSTPVIIREALKRSIELMLNGDQQAIYDIKTEVHQQIKTMSSDDIAFPRGINNIEKWMGSSTLYVKGTPIHVKAGLVFNHLLQQHSELSAIQPIQSGDKIKFVKLKTPNPIHEEVIGFPVGTELPETFGLNPYIDYDGMFNKTYIGPMTTLCAAAGLDLEQINNLSEFF